MRDPHVHAIHYVVSSDEGISYSNPKPVSSSNHLGTFDLSDGKLRIVPIEHFPDEDDARQAVEQFLRAWEIETDLTSHIGMIRFKFDRAEMIDRNPPPPGSPQIFEAKGTSIGRASCSASAHLTCSRYPQPPTTFRATLEVQHAYRRWVDYQLGKEPLLSMAYFVLTLLYKTAGNKQRAAHSFQISLNVLTTIGKLSTERGDESTVRKALPGKKYQKLSGSEKQWLEKAICLVIRRLGEHAFGAELTPISLRDLPSQ